MSPDPTTPRMRPQGWGADGHGAPLPTSALALVRDELGVPEGPRRDPVPASSIALPAPRLEAAARTALAAAVGEDDVRDDETTRLAHAAGRSYPDLVRLRSGEGLRTPDAVVHPASHDEVAAVLEICAAHGLAAVPFGGGTSVVGGVEPLAGDGQSGVVTLDLARLEGLLELDARSGLATLGAGTTGPRAEGLLAAHGLTLGHFPQSFEYSTVGGWVATRSAGQASTGYGRVEDLVVGLRAATPAGEMRTLAVPATAAGPSLREVLVGSEGVLGVITEATLRVRSRPAAIRDEAWSLPDLGTGAEALHALAAAGAAPAVTRLSDEEETRVQMTLAGDSTSLAALRRYLRLRGHGRGCLLVLGHEGSADAVADGRARTARILRRHGAVALGTPIGRRWREGRFHAPYLRDELMSLGVLVDTLETATTWSGLLELYRSVGAALRRALRAERGRPVVMCHVSHVYPTGASLYFTFLAAARDGEEIAQWRAAKTAAGDAIAAAGGTISHHHAVGRDHAPWLQGEIGRTGLDALRALKASLDPAGILNPGKLVEGELPR